MTGILTATDVRAAYARRDTPRGRVGFGGP